jgi:hypothetical protein
LARDGGNYPDQDGNFPKNKLTEDLPDGCSIFRSLKMEALILINLHADFFEYADGGVPIKKKGRHFCLPFSHLLKLPGE